MAKRNHQRKQELAFPPLGEAATTIGRWFDRFDENVGQLVASTASVTAAVAAHAQRIASIEVNYRSLDDKRAMDYKELNSRITAVQTELTEKISETTKSVVDHIDESFEKFRGERETADITIFNRIRVLERWRWSIIGGGAVALFVIAVILVKLGSILITLMSH